MACDRQYFPDRPVSAPSPCTGRFIRKKPERGRFSSRPRNTAAGANAARSPSAPAMPSAPRRNLRSARPPRTGQTAPGKFNSGLFPTAPIEELGILLAPAWYWAGKPGVVTGLTPGDLEDVGAADHERAPTSDWPCRGDSSPGRWPGSGRRSLATSCPGLEPGQAGEVVHLAADALLLLVVTSGN